MQTNYSAIALGAMVMALSAAAAGVSQDRIPELQREGRTEPTSATLTGCVARGAAAGTYILTNITKDDQTTAEDAFVRTSVLLSSTDVDVSKHIGHLVSVRGAYSSMGRAPRVAAMGTSAPTEGASQDGRLTSATFRVKSLAVLADSCSHAADAT